MAIEIYAYEPPAKGSTEEFLFPSKESSLRLYAVAPLEQRELVERWCNISNKEAEEADVTRRYKYNITAVEIWQ